MIEQLRARFIREQYLPSWLGLFVNPFFLARGGLATCMRAYGRHVRGRTLDIGCGSKPYQHLFDASEYVGMELYSKAAAHAKKADVHYDGISFPFGKETFDSVVSTQVIEHVPDPGRFLSRVHEVLKPDGVLLLSVPLLWVEHEQPMDFRRYSSFGLKAVIEEADFRIIEQTKVVSGIRACLQIVSLNLRPLG